MPQGARKSQKLDCGHAAHTVLPVEFRGKEIAFEVRAYQGHDEHTQAMALVNRVEGADRNAPVLVRVHSGCVTGDIFHSLRCDCRQQLDAALDEISKSPNGVLIYLPYQEGRGIGLYKKIQAYALQDDGFDTVDANVEIGEPIDARDYALAAEILDDLGIKKIRLMTNNPAKASALEEEGIKIAETIPLVVEPSEHNARYLATKRKRMSHKL